MVFSLRQGVEWGARPSASIRVLGTQSRYLDGTLVEIADGLNALTRPGLISLMMNSASPAGGTILIQ
jgi:hypothetical protein